eukprot:1785007-Amphidinium_carterae.1
MQYYQRCRETPNHPDHSLAYLGSMVERTLRRRRLLDNRQARSTLLRNSGYAYPAHDEVNHHQSGDPNEHVYAAQHTARPGPKSPRSLGGRQ